MPVHRVATHVAVCLALAWVGAAFAADRSPVAPGPAAGASGSKLTGEDAEAIIARMRQEQASMLSQIRRDLGAMPPDAPDRGQKLRLLAAIEKRINDEGAYPRRRYISPGSVREPYVVYYHALVDRIEDQGTRNFPASNGHKLYGEVVLNLTIDARGRIVETELIHGSGNAVLDQKAMRIARSAAPFGAFSDDMRKQADQIVTTSRFRFTHLPETMSDKASSGAASGTGAPIVGPTP